MSLERLRLASPRPHPEHIPTTSSPPDQSAQVGKEQEEDNSAPEEQVQQPRDWSLVIPVFQTRLRSEMAEWKKEQKPQHPIVAREVSRGAKPGPLTRNGRRFGCVVEGCFYVGDLLADMFTARGAEKRTTIE